MQLIGVWFSTQSYNFRKFLFLLKKQQATLFIQQKHAPMRHTVPRPPPIALPNHHNAAQLFDGFFPVSRNIIANIVSKYILLYILWALNGTHPASLPPPAVFRPSPRALDVCVYCRATTVDNGSGRRTNYPGYRQPTFIPQFPPGG